MVGTRHTVSDNKNRNGLGMPSPYITEVRRRKTIVNESTFDRQVKGTNKRSTRADTKKHTKTAST